MKKVSILNPVRIKIRKKNFSKEATQNKFSSETFYIYLIKRPIFRTDSLQLKLCDKNCHILPDPFYLNQLKILHFNQLPFKLKKIIYNSNKTAHISVKGFDKKVFQINSKYLQFFKQ